MNTFRIHLRPILGWVTVIALLTFPVLSVSGALDMFLKINGVEGESTDKTHPKEIDVLAWSWGMSNSGTTHSGAGTGAGKANVQDFSFTKYLDKSSPALMLGALKGEIFTEANFVVRRTPSSGSPYEYLKLKLENVLVTSISGGGAGNEDRLTENVTLNFSKFKLEYFIPSTTTAAGVVIYDIAAGSVP
jgi:type VI secretion system secreted protein Hcp